MSLYATMWEEISKEEYFSIYNDSLSVYASYTNLDGDDGLSTRPKILTSWGDEERELIKCIRTKGNRHDPEWRDEFLRAVEWEQC